MLEVVPLHRVAFQLSGDRIDVELELEPATGDGGTLAKLTVNAPRFSGVRRTLPSDALAKPADVVGPAPE